MAPMPAATADEAPPLEPPGVCARDQGLSVRPCRSFSVNQRTENAGVLVRPMITAPARRRLATTGLSSVARLSLKATTPLVVARPLQVDVDLDRHRHAVQRAQRLAAVPRRIGRVGRGQRLVGQQVDDGVQRGVDCLHTFQAGDHGLAGRDGAVRIAAASVWADQRQRGSDMGFLRSCLRHRVAAGASWWDRRQ